MFKFANCNKLPEGIIIYHSWLVVSTPLTNMKVTWDDNKLPEGIIIYHSWLVVSTPLTNMNVTWDDNKLPGGTCDNPCVITPYLAML